jgi:ketopantoate reductase
MLSDKITNGVIVGNGRIGSYLHNSNGKQDLLLSSRDDAIPEDSVGPIYICTRNDDLEAIIQKTPSHRKEDLVFIQNGMLGPYLESKGLYDNTQALIYFAISKKGEEVIDGKTSLNPDGLTAVTGKWAKDLAARLNKDNLACHVYDKETWTIAMFEKLIWISAFMAVGALHNGCTVGEVESSYKSEVTQLIVELAAAVTMVCHNLLPLFFFSLL